VFSYISYFFFKIKAVNIGGNNLRITIHVIMGPLFFSVEIIWLPLFITNVRLVWKSINCPPILILVIFPQGSTSTCAIDSRDIKSKRE